MTSLASAFGYAVSYKYANPKMADLIRSAGKRLGKEHPGCKKFGDYMTAMFTGRKWTQQIDQNYAHASSLVFISDRWGYYERQYFGICIHNINEYYLAYANGLALTNIPASIYPNQW